MPGPPPMRAARGRIRACFTGAKRLIAPTQEVSKMLSSLPAAYTTTPYSQPPSRPLLDPL
eukprot:463734-Prorocentrum_minimum.AAC.2